MFYGCYPKYQEKFFWKFREILDPTSSKEDYNLSNADVLSIVATMMGYSSPLIENGNWKKSEYGEVLDLVIKRFHNFYCYSSLGSEFSVSEQKNFIAKLLMILEMTSGRYLSILGVYDEAKTKLLDPVKTDVKTKSRFNDTPQNNGTYEEDPYTTTLTLGESSTEMGVDTIMGRIREIEGNYNNVLLNWSNEFDSLFIEEDNI